MNYTIGSSIGLGWFTGAKTSLKSNQTNNKYQSKNEQSKQSKQ
ncbi:MAG: hypothetical protein V7719_10315 [Psychroserpens sp.]